MNLSKSNTVTLDQVLRLVLPLSTKVMGGKEQRAREVTWTLIVTDFSHLHDQIQAGDIAILPSGLQEKADEAVLAVAIETLAERSAAALLLFDPPSRLVVERAADKGFAIVVVPDDVSLREIHQDITGLLVDRQKQINERGMQLYRRLTEMSREGQGLGAMTAVMSRLTEKAVVVQDKRLEILATTIPASSFITKEDVESILRRPDSLPEPLRNRKAAANIGQSHWQQLLPMGDIQIARLVSPIISGDKARGYVSVIGRPDELDLLDALTAEQGAAACALEMAKAKAISETRKALQGNFLEGLLAGTLPQQEIQRLAGRLEHNASRWHAILTFAWDGQNPPSLRRLETPVNWLLSSHRIQALTHIYGDEHLCVFQALNVEDEEMSSAIELANHILEHFKAEFPNTRLLSGLSGPAETLADWPDVHSQAVQAMKLGKRLNKETLIKYNSVGIYQLLAQLEDQPALRKFCDQVVGPLVNYDNQHRSSLVETLNAFFRHHANVSQTADALYIHRNTLLYRLERIQDLTGQDLDQADNRLALHLALRLWQLRPSEKDEG